MIYSKEISRRIQKALRKKKEKAYRPRVFVLFEGDPEPDVEGAFVLRILQEK